MRSSLSKWSICGLLFLATTLNYMDRMALNQTASHIKLAFSLSNEDYGWLEGAFSFAFALGALSIGILADKVSIWWLYPSMVVGWSAAGFTTGFASSYTMLLMCRFALGFFEAGNWPCGIRMTRTILPRAERSLGNALFQSGTAVGAVITPFLVMACAYWARRNDVEVFWPIPFRVIGLLGLVWVMLWFMIVPRRLEPIDPEPEVQRSSFLTVLRERRFWILVLVIIAVNTPWHAFRVWLPLFLKEGRGYSENFMQWFTAGYYIAADMGSISVGIISLRLVRSGLSVHQSRLIVFGSCALLTLLTGVIAFLPAGWLLLALLLILGYGALGLFPTYFSLSQELSAAHQGKVTGTLGFINALYLTLLFPIQGRIIDVTKSYGLGLAFAGVMPLIAFGVTWRFWQPRQPEMPLQPRKDV